MGWDGMKARWYEMRWTPRSERAVAFVLQGTRCNQDMGAAVQADTHLVSTEVNPRVTVQFSRHGWCLFRSLPFPSAACCLAVLLCSRQRDACTLAVGWTQRSERLPPYVTKISKLRAFGSDPNPINVDLIPSLTKLIMSALSSARSYAVWYRVEITSRHKYVLIPLAIKFRGKGTIDLKLTASAANNH